MINSKFSNDNVPVVLAFTPDYFVPAATCIFSILTSSRPSDRFHFICLLTQPLQESYKDKLGRLAEGRAKFSYINLDGALPEIYVDQKYTIAASYRLLLPAILTSLQKVLYVDCDMIFRNNLADLYRMTEIGDYYMAGVFEATLEFQKPYLSTIGCKAGEYINSGMLLMNLRALREDNMVEKLLDAAKEDHLQFPDQDVINQLCQGRIMGLQPYWNSIRTFWLPQYKPDFLKYYTLKDWKYIQDRGNIHYTGAKPWNTFTVGFDVWWYHFKQLPKDIREMMDFPKGLYPLASFYGSRIGKGLIDGARKLNRYIKTKKV
ncbi:glycosyltransferase family 8 protein [Sphingobacterium suaedae]|uniref:Glycosyltransferase family 8 protein n=1 Tax=Sphingobacterium suaedae TaxID=1686402 RepID=A0ABW5KMB7_9SPHI